MPSTVLMRCAAPMQSWGTRSRFRYRDTEREPSKSGALGLIAAALGRKRGEALDDLATLRMGVRIDSAGTVETDFQTALKVAKASGAKAETVLSYRHFLADANFLVAFEGDSALCSAVDKALSRPRWPLFLGRKGYVPGAPVSVCGGVRDSHLLDALQRVEWPRDGQIPRKEVEAVIECAAGQEGDRRWDVPLSFAIADRQYGARRVRRVMLQPGPEHRPAAQESQ